MFPVKASPLNSSRPSGGVARTSFRLDHARTRYGNDKLPSAAPIFFLLRQDFPGKVPAQHENVIRHLFEKLAGREDRQALPGHVQSLLMRVPVDHEIKELGPEIDIVDQGASLQ